MIKEFPLLDFRNAELLQYANSSVGLIETNNPTTLKVLPQLTAFKTRIAEAEALFILPRESSYSSEIHSLDTLRDTNFKGINQVIAGYTKHYLPQTRDAALLLTKNIKLYGSQINKLNYQAETTVINSMIKDWETKQELTDAIAHLNLLAWSTELKKNNTNFDVLYTQRTQEYGGKTQDKLKNKREEVNQAYRLLIDNINARNTLDETDMYTKVINEINALSTQYLKIMHNRKSRREDDEQDNKEDDTPSEE